MARQSRRTRARCLARVAAPSAYQRQRSLAQEGAFRVSAPPLILGYALAMGCAARYATGAWVGDSAILVRQSRFDCHDWPSIASAEVMVLDHIPIVLVELIAYGQQSKRDGVCGCVR